MEFCTLFQGEVLYKMSGYVKSQHKFSKFFHEVSFYESEYSCVVGCDVKAPRVSWSCPTVNMN